MEIGAGDHLIRKKFDTQSGEQLPFSALIFETLLLAPQLLLGPSSTVSFRTCRDLCRAEEER